MLTIVTGNPRKFEKIVGYLPKNLEIQQQDLDIVEIQSMSIDEISADKALKAFEIIQSPVLVEDTGIYFGEYESFPGPFAKQAYQSLWRVGMKRLFQDAKNQEIRFRSVVSYMDATLQIPMSFAAESIGTANFDFPNAPIDLHIPYMSFFCWEWADEVASMSKSISDERHHRVRAVKKFGSWFNKK